MKKTSQRVLIAYNTCWYVWMFRMPLIRTLLSQGREVIVLAPHDEYTDRIVAEGIRYREIRLRAKGKNPFQEMATTFAFLRAYRQVRPDIILHYTIKPNLYGSIGARLLRIPVIDNVTGLGAAFERRGPLPYKSGDGEDGGGQRAVAQVAPKGQGIRRREKGNHGWARQTRRCP